MTTDPYIVPGDFRAGTALAPYCNGLALGTADASDSMLTAVIAEMSTAFDGYTNDRFVSSGTATIAIVIDSRGGHRLDVDRRMQSISLVEVRTYLADWTSVAASSYRFEPFTGAMLQVTRRAEFDVITAVGPVGNLYYWPNEPQSVRLTGVFDWPSCPARVKRAVALMTYRDVQAPGDRAWEIPSYEMRQPGNPILPALPSVQKGPTGIPKVDEIIGEFSRIEYEYAG